MSLRSHLVLITAAATLVCVLVAASIALAADPPVAQTGAARDVSDVGATLTATVTPSGAATTVRFDVGRTTAYGLQSASKDVGSGTEPVAVEIPVQGLSAGATYHFRVVATSDGGTVQGADATLTTSRPPARPTAITVGVRDVSPTGATLTGSVNPQRASTSWRFEYGPTTSYGSSTAATDVGAGSRSVGVSAAIGGLTPGARYHYRLVATNSMGTAVGADRSFFAATTATSATLSADQDRVTYGRSVKVRGRLGGSRVSRVRVRLQTTAFPFDRPFADVGTPVLSTTKGDFAFLLPAVTTTLRALVVVDGLPPFFSRPVVVRSAARAGITAVTRRADGRVVVRGRVIPATANGVAALQRRSASGRWLPLARAHVGADGRYAVTLRPRRRAIVVRTVGLPHDGGAHVSGTSRSVKVAARR
jgi:hypothetical protein